MTEVARTAGRPLLKVIDPVDLTEPKVRFQFKFAPFYCEFLTPTNHIEFDRLMSRAQIVETEFQKVRMVALLDIVAMKNEAVLDSQNALEKHSADLKRLRVKLAKTSN